MKLLLTLLTAAAIVASIVACSDSPFTPTTENVAGDYSLQTLIAVYASEPIDWREAGATLNISLAPNGTTSGHLFIPHSDESGADFNVDMAGTWALSGDTVTFTQTGDSFVRDMAWIADEHRLSGDHTLGDDRVIAVIRK